MHPILDSTIYILVWSLNQNIVVLFNLIAKLFVHMAHVICESPLRCRVAFLSKNGKTSQQKKNVYYTLSYKEQD